MEEEVSWGAVQHPCTALCRCRYRYCTVQGYCIVPLYCTVLYDADMYCTVLHDADMYWHGTCV